MKKKFWLSNVLLIMCVLVLGLAADGMARDGYGMYGRDWAEDNPHGDWNYCPYCGSDLGGGYHMGPGWMHRGYGPGYGRGPGMRGRGDWSDMGPGRMNGYYGPGYGRQWRGDRYGDLTEEQADKLRKAREEFYSQTRPLVNQIQDKQFALNEELASPKPDRQKVTQLQKEISRLRSEYDQKALEHRLEVREILPDRQSRPDSGQGTGGQQ